jgi:hypothetical protein
MFSTEHQTFQTPARCTNNKNGGDERDRLNKLLYYEYMRDTKALREMDVEWRQHAQKRSTLWVCVSQEWPREIVQLPG